MDLRVGRIWRNAPWVKRYDGRWPDRIHLLVARMLGRRVHRNLFLQEQLYALDARVCMKAPDHALLEEIITERKQDHTLMMHHVRADDCMALTGLQALGREIDRFIKPVESPHLKTLKPCQVLHHCLRCER